MSIVDSWKNWRRSQTSSVSVRYVHFHLWSSFLDRPRTRLNAINPRTLFRCHVFDGGALYWLHAIGHWHLLRIRYRRRVQLDRLNACPWSFQDSQNGRHVRVEAFFAVLNIVWSLHSIKKGLRSVKGAAEFSLVLDSNSSMVFNSEALKDTETTITVS